MKNSKKICQNKVKLQQFGSTEAQYPLSNTCFMRQNRLKNVYHSVHANEHGRSMVEMLGVLAVVGVLSIGGIQGYSYAMNKYRANQILNELNIASYQLATVLLRNENEELTLSLGEPYDSGRITSAGYAFNYGCGNGLSEEDCGIDETGYWFALNGVPENICKNMMTMADGMPYLAEKELNGSVVTDDTNCVDENNEITFLFNSDGSGELSDNTGNDDETEDGGNGENGDNETEETPPVDCGEHGTWNKNLSKCVCQSGWGGSTCEKSINESCNENGYWMSSRGLCVCKEGFGGLNCDQDPREVCNNHGSWNGCGGGCLCESGYGGTYCQNEINDKYCNNGVWVNNTWGTDGYCKCNTGFGGPNCSMTQEEANAQYCNDGGIWKSSMNGGFCKCTNDLGGRYCTETVDKTCSGKGTWKEATDTREAYCDCYMNKGYGPDCSLTYSEMEKGDTCSNNGRWYNGRCMCKDGYTGDDCSITCQHSIEFSGIDGYCTCDAGWAGEGCDVLEKDHCVNGVWNTQAKHCLCENGWIGESCDIPANN